MISERGWLTGAFVVTLAGASISTWTATGPRFEATASAATRHRSAAQRDEVADTIHVSAPEPPAAVPAAPTVRRRRAPRQASITIQILDLPEPASPPPLLWDDMFPAPPRRADGTPAPAAPCFDRLQGIEGLSPCPAVTPR